MDTQIGHLIKKLENSSIAINEINLFNLSIDILKRRNKFDAILKQKSKLTKDKFT